MASTGMELPLIDVPALPTRRIRRQKPIKVCPEELYIEPTSVCNLKCTMCYTNVINGPDRRTLSYEEVTDFAQRYLDAVGPVVNVYWCGTGEAFLHKDFPRMVNRLLEYGPDIEQTIQTNGTIDRLDEFTSLERLSFNVSIDGPKELHEWHRGPNTFDRTLRFCKAALDRGCQSICIRCLLRRDNIERLDEYHQALTDWLGPRFTLELNPPFDNSVLRPVRDEAQAINQHDIDDSRTITTEEAVRICAEKYRGKYEICVWGTVDNYISLTTYGVFTCCHGILKIGEIVEPIPTLMQRMIDSKPRCLSCAMHPCQ
jgi:sulfatase maturation enzyme AslB (radical SAM superfamily)